MWVRGCRSERTFASGNDWFDMGDDRKRIGDLGEKLVAGHLKKLKYEIRETNFRCKIGEIDIVAQDGDCLVFVEVRTKTGLSFGTPEESITSTKKAKLVATGLWYLQAHDCMTSPWRIDVVAVELGPNGKVARMEHIKSAVDWTAADRYFA